MPTLEQIQNYINQGKSLETCELVLGDFTIEARTGLTVSEQMSVVKACVDALPITSDTPSPILISALLNINFVIMVAPSLPLPVDEDNNVDIDEACRIIDGLGFIGHYNREANGQLYWALDAALQRHIMFYNDKRIAWQSVSTASDEAIEAVAEVANQAKMVAFNLNGVLEEVKGVLGDAKPKLLKFITKKNVDKMMVWLENLVSGAVRGGNSDSVDNVVDIEKYQDQE